MINEKLKSDKYYLDNLSLFMQNSYGIKDHIELFTSLIKDLDVYYDDLWKYLDIFVEKDYLSNSEKVAFVHPMLDIIGKIFNISRNVVIKEYEQDSAGTYSNKNDYTIQSITLNNEEFLTYIKCQILKNNFNGTREDLIKKANNKEYENDPEKVKAVLTTKNCPGPFGPGRFLMTDGFLRAEHALSYAPGVQSLSQPPADSSLYTREPSHRPKKRGRERRKRQKASP